MNKFGYWNDWTGACHKVQILAETTDGKLVVELPSLGVSIMDKADIWDIEEGEANEPRSLAEAA